MNREELRSLVRTVFIVCFIVTLALGLWIVGTPENARKKKEDLALIDNLIDITNEIGRYIGRNNGLPKTLDTLSVNKNKIKNIIYNPGDQKNGTYDCLLCSKFNLEGGPEDCANRYYQYRLSKQFCKHSAGHVCFKIRCSKGKSDDSIFCSPV